MSPDDDLSRPYRIKTGELSEQQFIDFLDDVERDLRAVSRTGQQARLQAILERAGYRRDQDGRLVADVLTVSDVDRRPLPPRRHPGPRSHRPSARSRTTRLLAVASAAVAVVLLAIGIDAATTTSRSAGPASTGTHSTHSRSNQGKPTQSTVPPPGTTLRTLNSHIGRVYSVAFSPDGRSLAVTSDIGAEILDLASGKSLERFPGGQLLYVTFSPDGHSLAVTSQKTAQILSVGTGAVLHQLAFTSTGSGGRLSFSPDGRTLAAAADRGTEIWDVASGRHLRTLPAIESYDVAFAPDGTLATTSAKGAQIWDPATGRVLHSFTSRGSYGFTAFSSDGLTLATTSEDRAQIWDIATGRAIQHFDVKGTYGGVTFWPGDRLGTASDNAANIWDIATGKATYRLPLLDPDDPDGSNVDGTPAFSPDGRTMAISSNEPGVKLWEVPAG